MSSLASSYPNGTDPDARWQAQVSAVARALPYPPTPNLAPVVRAGLRSRPAFAPLRRRPVSASPRLPRWAVGLAVGVMLVSALLAVPGVRAGVLRWLPVGAVRILFAPERAATPPLATPLASVLDIAGQTTLAEARARAGFPIRLPTYPADLGQPDQVFVQGTADSAGGTMVVLVWLDPAAPERVRLALYLIDSPVIADKLFYGVIKQSPPQVETAEVNGEPAVWTSGPYVLETRAGRLAERRLIEGQVLIWVDEELTYRLETDRPLAEAVRLAESLE